MSGKITYNNVGVNYDLMDPFKCMAQAADVMRKGVKQDTLRYRLKKDSLANSPDKIELRKIFLNIIEDKN